MVLQPHCQGQGESCGSASHSCSHPHARKSLVQVSRCNWRRKPPKLNLKPQLTVSAVRAVPVQIWWSQQPPGIKDSEAVDNSNNRTVGQQWDTVRRSCCYRLVNPILRVLPHFCKPAHEAGTHPTRRVASLWRSWGWRKGFPRETRSSPWVLQQFCSIIERSEEV